MEEIKFCSLKLLELFAYSEHWAFDAQWQIQILATLLQVGNFITYNELYFVNFLSFEE